MNASARAPKHKKMRSVEYIDMPHEQRVATYEEVIFRMHRFGIMSPEYAHEALKRVRAD